jgi:dihydroflavonol-4-reductase
MTADLAVVTGGAGHLGTNLVEMLTAAGEQVRVVDLREPVTARGFGAGWVRADVRDVDALREAFRDATVVYHLGSLISTVGGLGGRVESINVGGAEAVARAALDAGVRRLVHCSSIHAFDIRRCPTVDEGSPPSVGPQAAPYDRSKALGEAKVRDAIADGLDAVIVNPTSIIGPRDEAPSRMGIVLREFWRGRVAAAPTGGFDWVDVRDVATALQSAARQGRTGENYLVGGHHCTGRRLLQLAASVIGTKRRIVSVPLWLLRIVSPITTIAARRTGNPLFPSTEALETLAAFPRVSHAKAARELGHAPRALEDTLRDLHRYYTNAGVIPG